MNSKILLVEDDDKIREIICEYFAAKSEGNIEISDVSSGEDGLELIHQRDFDLVSIFLHN